MIMCAVKQHAVKYVSQGCHDIDFYLC